MQMLELASVTDLESMGQVVSVGQESCPYPIGVVSRFGCYLPSP